MKTRILFLLGLLAWVAGPELYAQSCTNPTPLLQSEFLATCLEPPDRPQPLQLALDDPSFLPVECFVACANSTLTYSTEYHSGNLYEWEIFGETSSTVIGSGNSIEITWGAAGSGMIRLTEIDGDCATSIEECVFIVESPEADFSTIPSPNGDQIQICLNDAIYFTDLSTGGVTNWLWDFGDGVTSNSASPSHQYADPGNYTVVLTVFNECGCSDTQSINVLVDPAQAPEIACVGTECQGDNASYSVPNACPGATYEWSLVGGVFTNGTTSSDPIVDVLWDNPVNGQGQLTVTVLGCDLCPIPSTVIVPILTNQLVMDGPEIVCLDDLAFYSVSPQPGNTFTWHVSPPVPGFNPNPAIDDHSIEIFWTEPGTYSLQLVSEYSTLFCGDLNPAVLGKSITVLPDFAFAYTDLEICQGGLISGVAVNGNHSQGGGTGLLWEAISPDGEVIVLPSTNNSISINTVDWEPGYYEIRATTTTTGYFCNESISTHLNVVARPELLTVSDLNGPLEVCVNSNHTYSVTSSVGASISWQVVGGYFNGDLLPPFAHGESVNVTWTDPPFQLKIREQWNDSPQCSGEWAFIDIAEVPIGPLNIDGPSSVCSDGTYTYTVSPNENISAYDWSISPAIAGSIISASNGTIQIQFNDYDGIAAILLDATICETIESANFLALVGDPPAVTIIANEEDCQGYDVDFSVQPTPIGSVSYAWDFGDGSTSTLAAPTHTFANQGSHAVTVVITYNEAPCFNKTVNGSHIINIKPSPLLNITATEGYAICLPDIPFTTLVASIQAQPGSGTMGYDYQWSGGTSPNSSSNTVFDPGVYGLTVSDPVTGCSSTSAVTISGDCNPAEPCSGVDFFYSQTDCSTFNFNSILFGWNSPQWYFGDGTSSTQPDPSHTYTASGYYQVTLVGYNGEEFCIKTETIAVIFVPDFIWEFSCNGSNEIETQLIDQTNYIQNPSLTYAWTYPSGSSNDPNPTVSLTPGETHTVSLTVSDGVETCTVSYQVEVPAAITADFTHDAPQCEGSPVSFESTYPGNFSASWDFGDGASSLLTDPQRTYAYTGTNPIATLTAVDAWGCTATSSQAITIVENTLNINVDDTTPSCAGQNLQLTANISGGQNPLSYQWESSDGGIDLGDNATSDPVTTSGDYVLEVTDALGCRARSDAETVVIYPQPEAHIIGAGEFCLGDAIRFYANQGSNYDHFWEGSLTITNPYSNQLDIAANVVGSHSVAVTVTDEDTGCSDVAVHNFVVHALPEGLSVDPNPACAPADLTASVTSGGSTTFAWSNGTTGATTTALTGGPLEVFAYNEAGCQASTEVEMSSGPDLADVAVGCYCFPWATTWHAPQGPGYTYQWYFNGVPIKGGNEHDYTISNSGVYQVEITDANGCSALSEDIIIEIGEACGVCDFGVTLRTIECVGYDEENGGNIYDVSFVFTNNGTSLAGLTGISDNGILHQSSLSTTTLPGQGTVTLVTGSFTLYDGETSACITFTGGGNDGFSCGISMCINSFPDCPVKDCDVSWHQIKVECLFTKDGYSYYDFSIAATNLGNAMTDLVWYPCHSPYVSVSTSTNTLPSNVSTLIEGTIIADSDFPNECFYICGYDRKTRKRCCWLVVIDFPECNSNLPCKDMKNKQSKLLCRASSTDADGNRVYDFDILVYSPLANAEAMLLPLWGQLENQVTNLSVSVTGNYYHLTGTIIDTPPFDSPLCFLVMTTDERGRYCWMKLCLKIPHCHQAQAEQESAGERDLRRSQPTMDYDLQISPNPVSDWVNFHFASIATMESRLQIRDLNGRLLLERELEPDSTQRQLDLSKWAGGLYLVTIEEEGRVVAREKMILLD